MLEAVGVVVGEAGRERLNRCSLTVRPGEVVGVVGPTGAGKSTLLEVLAGHRRPERGRLTWEGRDVTRSPERLAALAALAGHETPGPHSLTVRAWLALWAELDAVTASSRRARVEEAVGRFELASAAERAVSALSRGGLRRLAWARAWVRRPKLLLLDGPDDGVDGAGLRTLTQLVKDAAAEGATVVLTSVAPHVPTLLCDRVAVLVAGAVTHELVRGAPGFAAGVATAQGWSS